MCFEYEIFKKIIFFSLLLDKTIQNEYIDVYIETT